MTCLSTLLVLLVAPTLLGKQILKDAKADGNHFHLVSKETQQRASKKSVDPERDLVKEALDKEMVKAKIREKWKTLTGANGPVEVDTSVPRVRFGNSRALTLKEAFQFLKFYPVLLGEEARPTNFEIPIGTGNPKKFKLKKQTRWDIFTNAGSR